MPPASTTPAVVFIGQNPGYQEDQAGINFVGPAGQLTRLAYIGCSDPQRGTIGSGIFHRATVYLANVARCGTWGGIEPTRKQYSACMPYLLPDLLAIASTCKRLILVPMGGPAIEHTYKLLTSKGLSVKAAADRSGETLKLPESSVEVQVFSTYHPAYVNRKNAMLGAVIDHLRLVVDSLDGISAVPSKPTIISPTELLALARQRAKEYRNASSQCRSNNDHDSPHSTSTSRDGPHS